MTEETQLETVYRTVEILRRMKNGETYRDISADHHRRRSKPRSEHADKRGSSSANPRTKKETLEQKLRSRIHAR